MAISVKTHIIHFVAANYIMLDTSLYAKACLSLSVMEYNIPFCFSTFGCI